MAFTHLHVHTEYSLLDGSCKIKELVGRAKELGMDSMAITDHGVMYLSLIHIFGGVCLAGMYVYLSDYSGKRYLEPASGSSGLLCPYL